MANRNVYGRFAVASEKTERRAMIAIANSDAYMDADRLLPQHRAALTLLQGRLSTPGRARFAWLDLACGRGQIIASLDENLSTDARSKIEYWAYDVNHDFARETARTAEGLDFAELETTVGDLSDFDKLLPDEVRFDFITLTNTVHEIEPMRLATVLVNSVSRLTPDGTLFVYDMDRVRPPELGALPWGRDDIRQIVYAMLDALGAGAYRPEVGLWKHRTCSGWNVQLARDNCEVADDSLRSRLSGAIEQTRDEITRILNRRLSECVASLEALTVYGPQTAVELDDRERLLYEHWALSRASERIV